MLRARWPCLLTNKATAPRRARAGRWDQVMSAWRIVRYFWIAARAVGPIGQARCVLFAPCRAPRDHTTGDIDVFRVQADESFADADAGRGKADSSIAFVTGVEDVSIFGRVQKLGDLFFSHKLRRTLFLLGRAWMVIAGVIRGDRTLVCKFEEAAAGGGEFAGHGGLGVVVVAHEAEVVAHIVRRGIQGDALTMLGRHVDLGERSMAIAAAELLPFMPAGMLPLASGVVERGFRRNSQKELAELPEIGAVAAAGVSGKVAFKLQVV